MSLSPDDLVTLETEFVDQYTLSTVLDALAEIAREKAEHLRSSWQDPEQAKDWDRAARRLEQVARGAAFNV